MGKPATKSSFPSIVPARHLQRGLTPEWTRAALAGRLAELSGAGPSATFTLACALVLDAQQRDEPAAWVTSVDTSFFPPDVAAGGIDLSALPVVRVSHPHQLFRAADKLVRSGAFALVVLDLAAHPHMPMAVQTRLAGLAKKHTATILCLTKKPSTQPSLGSLVSLRGEARRERQGEGRFLCEVYVLKDKRRGPGWSFEELCSGPTGLR